MTEQNKASVIDTTNIESSVANLSITDVPTDTSVIEPSAADPASIPVSNSDLRPTASLSCEDSSCCGHTHGHIHDGRERGVAIATATSEAKKPVKRTNKPVLKPALRSKTTPSKSISGSKKKQLDRKNKHKVRFNDKNDRSKTVQQTDEEKLFIIAMKPFVVQAVSGTFMAFLTNKSLDHITSFKEINPMLTMFLRIYLNVCWHGYGKKNDTYVVDTFNKLFEHEMIKRVICLIDWIDVIGRSMINAINLDESIKQLRTMNLTEQRSVVSTNMQIMYAVITSELTDLKCTDAKCITSPSDVYDGEDFYVTDE